jgi:hypothetical protein
MPVEQPFGQRRVIIPVLERISGATYNDMRWMETLLLLWAVRDDPIACALPRHAGRLHGAGQPDAAGGGLRTAEAEAAGYPAASASTCRVQ